MESGSKFLAAAAALGLAFSATNAQAAPCSSYGSATHTALEGTTVCFVYETAVMNSLWGPISVVGDSIQTIPTDFRAESNDGVGVHSGTQTDTLDANNYVQVIAKDGYVLDGITIGELGDYRMSGTHDTNVDVDIDGWAAVWDYNVPLALAPFLGQYEQNNLTVIGDLTIADGNTHNWQAFTSFDLTGAAWDGLDHVGLQLQNNLMAFSLNPGDQAWIEKKAIAGGVSISVDTDPGPGTVPVPAAVWLFASGLIGLTGIARRKRM